MTPLSSTRKDTVRTFYNTSTTKTHTSNSQWNPHNRTHSPSWTLSSPSNQTTPSAPQCTGNPPTQINIYTGTATTTSQQNKVSLTPWHTGPKQYPPLKPAWTRNWTTSRQPSNIANSPPGPSTNGNTGSTSHNNIPTTPPTIQTDKTKNKATIVVPYIPNTSEKFKKVCKRKGIQVHFKGSNTLRTALGNPKDKDPKANQTGIIYHYQCPHTNCPSSYIGESGRTLGDRIKEHFKALSPIHLHSSTTGHPMDPNQFSIVHKEVNSHPRTIKEAMFICVQDPPIKHKPWKVPASPHMGPSTSGITNTSVQANQPTIQHHSYLTPLLVPPTLQSLSSLPLTPWCGAHQFFFPMVSTHVYPKYPPLLIYN